MSYAVTGPGTASSDFWDSFGNALFSRNLWLYIAAFEVAITLLSPLPGERRSPLLNLMAGVIAAAALLAVVAVGWLLARRFTGLARVLVAVPVVVLAGVARGLTLQAVLSSWGLSDLGAPAYKWRAIAGVTVVVLGALVGSLLKLGVEGHRQRLEVLAAEQQRLALVLQQTQREVRSDQSETVDKVRQSLTEQLQQVAAASPALAPEWLSHMTMTVVRPLSHELAAASPTWAPPEVRPQKVDWSRVWGSACSISYIEPLGPALFILAAAPLSMIFMGVSGLWLHLVAAVGVCAGLWLLRHFFAGVGAGRSTAVRMVLILALLTVACVPAAVMVWFFPSTTSPDVNALHLVLVVPLVALLISFVRATRIQRRELEERVEEFITQTRWWIARTRMTGWWQGAALARALHGPVQTALHTATARVRDCEPEEVEGVLHALGATLTEIVVRPPGSPDVAAELADLSSFWQALSHVDVYVSPRALQLLGKDVTCAEIAVDIIGEGVSNAVRHGEATHLSVTVEAPTTDILSLFVRDDGSGWEGHDSLRPTGVGTSQLHTCAVSWEYVESAGNNLLHVELPLLPQH